jgi:hypothetical protein
LYKALNALLYALICSTVTVPLNLSGIAQLAQAALHFQIGKERRHRSNALLSGNCGKRQDNERFRRFRHFLFSGDTQETHIKGQVTRHDSVPSLLGDGDK